MQGPVEGTGSKVTSRGLGGCNAEQPEASWRGGLELGLRDCGPRWKLGLIQRVTKANKRLLTDPEENVV